MHLSLDSAPGKTFTSLFPEPWGSQEGRRRHPETNSNRNLLWSLRKWQKEGTALESSESRKHRGSRAKPQGRYSTDIQEGHCTCKHGGARTQRMVGCVRENPLCLRCPSCSQYFPETKALEGSCQSSSERQLAQGILLSIEPRGKGGPHSGQRLCGKWGSIIFYY